jgi:chromosome segregation ATPase
MATAETVVAAVEALLPEKLEPTVERVRSKLGGGSFSTISRLLSDVLAEQQTRATQISEVPSDLVAVGQQAVGAIYAAVQRQAAAKIEVIEANARKHIEAANHGRAEAALEIERLERETEQLTEAAAAQAAIHDALGRAERAEATVLAARAEIERLAHAFAAAQADAQAARESDQEAQKRAARSEEGRREAETMSRKEINELRQALARSDAAAARASGELERIVPLLQATEKDAKALRSEREQLQLKLVKAETSIESMQTELLAVKKDRDTAREHEQRAHDEAAEARGRLKALGGDAEKSRDDK